MSLKSLLRRRSSRGGLSVDQSKTSTPPTLLQFQVERPATAPSIASPPLYTSTSKLARSDLSLPNGSYFLSSATLGDSETSTDEITFLPNTLATGNKGHDKNQLKLATWRPPKADMSPESVALSSQLSSDNPHSSWQVWYFEKVSEWWTQSPSGNVYTISNVARNKLLRAATEYKRKGKSIAVCLIDADSAPLTGDIFWTVEKIARGYKITNAESGMCLMRCTGKGYLVTDEPDVKLGELDPQLTWRFWKAGRASGDDGAAVPYGWVKIQNAANGMNLQQDVSMAPPYLSTPSKATTGCCASEAIASQWAVIDRRAMINNLNSSSKSNSGYRSRGFLLRNRLTGVYLAHVNIGDHKTTTVTAGGKGYNPWEPLREEILLWDIKLEGDKWVISVPETGDAMGSTPEVVHGVEVGGRGTRMIDRNVGNWEKRSNVIIETLHENISASSIPERACWILEQDI